MIKIPTCFFLASCSLLLANPINHQVIEGSADIAHIDDHTMHVTVSDRSIIHWEDFSIAQKEMTKFIMPNGASSVLNRVVTDIPSQIMGSLEANGQVFLINPNGILIGPDATINVANFVAATFDVLNEKFLNNEDLLFQGDAKTAVVNLGKIHAWDGDVVLLGYYVKNEGLITAENGTCALAAGKQILLQPLEKQRIFIQPQKTMSQKEDSIGIDNTGQIEALSTEIKADGNIYALAIKDAATIDAMEVRQEGGKILLYAEEGKLEVSGTYTAVKEDDHGGEIHFLGEEVHLLSGTTVDACGDVKGGEILVGGDLQGKNLAIYNSQSTFVDTDVILLADAKKTGDGGKIIIWGTQACSCYGTISTRGGSISGDGGMIEVSSKGYWRYHPILCDRRAPHGKAGLLLLDPVDVVIHEPPVISNPALAAPMVPPSYPGAGLSADAILDVDDLVASLNAGDVIIDSTVASNYTPEGNVYFNTNIPTSAGNIWTASTTLSIYAQKDIFINGSITHNNASTRQLLQLETAANGGGSVYIFKDITSDASPTIAGQSIIELSASQNVVIDAPITLTGSPANAGDPSLTCTAELGDIIVRDAVVTSGTIATQDILMISGRDIIIGDGTQSTDAYLQASQPITLLADNNIVLQGTLTESSGDAYIQGGNIQLGAVRDIIIRGGHATDDAAAYLSGAEIEIVTNNVYDNSLYIQGGSRGNCPAYIRGTEGIKIESARGITIMGGSDEATNAMAYIEKTVGSHDISIIADGNIFILGGSASSSDAYVYHNGTGGDLTVTATNGNIEIMGGAGLNSKAGIIDHVNGSGSLNVTAGENILLQGGDNEVAYAVIERLNATDPVTNLTVSTTNGELHLLGGSYWVGGPAVECGAFIRHTGNGETNIDINGKIALTAVHGRAYITHTNITNGDLLINTHAHELILQGGSFADAFANIDAIVANSGNLTIQEVSNLRLLGGSSFSGNSGAWIRYNNINAIPGKIEIETIHNQLLIEGGTGASSDAYIMNDSGGPILVGKDVSPVTADIALKGGNGGDIPNSALASIYTTQGGDIAIYTTGNYALVGGTSSNNSLASIATATQGGVGNITLVGRNMKIQGSVAGHQNMAGIITGAQFGEPVGGAGSIDIALEDSLYVQGSDMNKGYISIKGTGGDTLKIIANRNIEILDYGVVESNSTGKVTLVTDNAFPIAPNIGNSLFTLSSKGSITAPSVVAIYTGDPVNVSIANDVNGSTYSLPPYNTLQHQFSTYYPIGIVGGGPGFVFYYKIAEPGLLPGGALSNALSLGFFYSSELFYRLAKEKREDMFAVNPYERYIDHFRIFSVINDLEDYKDLDNEKHYLNKLQHLWAGNVFFPVEIEDTIKQEETTL